MGWFVYKSHPSASVVTVSVQCSALDSASLRMRGCSSTTGPGHLLGTGANMATQPLTQPRPPLGAQHASPPVIHAQNYPNVIEDSCNRIFQRMLL